MKTIGLTSADTRRSLPESWQETDAINSFYEAVRVIGEDVKAGRRELPEYFRSTRETVGEP